MLDPPIAGPRLRFSAPAASIPDANGGCELPAQSLTPGQPGIRGKTVRLVNVRISFASEFATGRATPTPCAGQKTPGLLRYLGRRLVDLFEPDGCVALGPCSADPAGENGAQRRRMGERHEDMANNYNEKA